MTLLNQHKLSEGEIKILEALSSAGGGKDWLTAFAVAHYAREQQQDINAPTVYRTLSRLREMVEYRTSDRVRRFHLKQTGRDLIGLNLALNGFQFISPGTPWSTQRQLKTFLGQNSKEFLFIIDPYISEETLDVLMEVNVPISILTANTGRKGREIEFARAYKKFKREKNGHIEVRRVSSDELHGRYLLTKSCGWVVDHSLQDLGTKPAIILPLYIEPVFGAVHSHFVSVFKKGAAVV